MERKLVGYFLGTDPIWLTTLEAQGYDTLPISNGFDSHGLHVSLITSKRPVNVLLSYFHKLVPPMESEMSVAEILHTTTVYDIPVLVACPAGLQEAAQERIGDIPVNVEFVDPADIMARAGEILSAASAAGS